MDEKKEMQDLIRQQNEEAKKELAKAEQRTGLERRGGKERRKKEVPFRGAEKRRDLGRRGKYDRRTEGGNFGYKDEDDKE